VRRRAVIALFGAAAASPFTARAQRPVKVARIGCLSGGSRDFVRRNLEFFRQELARLGYTEGRNIAFEYRFAEGDFERLPQLAAELVSLEVDVIVASPTPAAVAAKKATGAIPIVMVNAGDPVGLGLVQSLAHPGGNVTGLAFSVALETLGKGLELLKDAVPNLNRVAVLLNPANPAYSLAKKHVEIAAAASGVQLQLLEVRSQGDFANAFAAMTQERAGAVIIVPDVLSVENARQLAQLAVSTGLPSMHGFREQVEAGGLISYGPNLIEPFRHAAAFVDKLLKGAKPADLPVQQPTKFELVINLKTARALGITIPTTLLARADEVIE